MNLNEFINKHKDDILWPISHTFIPLFLFLNLRLKHKINNVLYQFFFIIAITGIFEIIEMSAFLVSYLYI